MLTFGYTSQQQKTKQLTTVLTLQVDKSLLFMTQGVQITNLKAPESFVCVCVCVVLVTHQVKEKFKRFNRSEYFPSK